jgi:uncharacterized protein YciI
MTFFLCKMILPRSDFVQTMTDSEQNIMKAHGDYLQSLTEVGSIVCHGPVDDPEGGWGLSIFSAKDLRGLSGIRDEVLLTATAQNLRRLARLLCRAPPPLAGACLA